MARPAAALILAFAVQWLAAASLYPLLVQGYGVLWALPLFCLQALLFRGPGQALAGSCGSLAAGLVGPDVQRDAFAIDRFILEMAAAQFQFHRVQAAWALSLLLAPWAGPFLSRARGVCLVAVLALGLALWLSAMSFHPGLTRRAVEPVGPGFAYDGHLYLRTYWLMKGGQSYWQAGPQAFQEDARKIPIFSLRPPLWYWFWQVWPAYPAGFFLWAGVHLGVCCWVGWVWAGPRAALLVPVLQFPLWHYHFVTSSGLFTELWSGTLVLGGWGAIGMVRGGAAAGLLRLPPVFFGVATMGRDIFVMHWAAALPWTSPRRSWPVHLGMAVLAAAYFLWHNANARPLMPPAAESHFVTGFSHWPNFRHLWAGWEWGRALTPFPIVFALLSVSVCLYGARKELALATFGPMLMLLVFSHPALAYQGQWLYPPDYWGLLFRPLADLGVAVGVARLCGGGEAGGIGEGSAGGEVASADELT